jgi:hypothetical protein
MSSRPALGATQPPIQWVPLVLSRCGGKRQGREADHLPPATAKVNKNVNLYFHSPVRPHGVVLTASVTYIPSNKVTSKLECAEDKFQTRRWVRETPPTTSYARGIWLGMRGLVGSYVTLAIPTMVPLIKFLILSYKNITFHSEFFSLSLFTNTWILNCLQLFPPVGQKARDSEGWTSD